MAFKYMAVLVCLVAIGSAEDCIRSIIWKKYNGTAPFDAIIKLQDATGGPIYIGQVEYEGHTLLADISGENPEQASFYFGGEKKNTKENVKILCSENHDSFAWVLTTSEELFDVEKMNYLIPGGEENGEVTYIGRTQDYNQELGKVVISKMVEETKMYVVDDEAKSYTTFYVLVYKGCDGYLDLEQGQSS